MNKTNTLKLQQYLTEKKTRSSPEGCDPLDPAEPHYLEGIVPFCAKHEFAFYFQEPEVRIVPSLKTREEREVFLTWYYTSLVSVPTWPHQQQDLEWLSTKVNPYPADQDKDLPLGMFLQLSKMGVWEFNPRALFGEVDREQGFGGLWLLANEQFMQCPEIANSFQAWLKEKYALPQLKQKRLVQLQSLSCLNENQARWSAWLSSAIEDLLVSLPPFVSAVNLEDSTTSAPLDPNRVSVFGFPRAEFGIGEVTRSSLFALSRTSIPFESIDLGRGLPHPQTDFSTDQFLSEKPTGAFMLLHGPLQYPWVLRNQGYNSDFFNQRYVIGYCPWEFDQWSENLNFYYRFYDEIWAPTLFVQRAFENNGHCPVYHMPYPVFIPSFEIRSRNYFNLPENKFLFLAMFDFNSKIERKNPRATVRAFQEAFPGDQDVALVIKVMYASENDLQWREFLEIVKQDARIKILNQVLSRPDTLALLNAVDSFVSLHRSEGFGLGLAEAMLLGKSVVATQYSGNADFCSSDWSFPVDYQLIKVEKHQYPFAEGFLWADPIIESAAQQLREVRNNQIEVTRRTSNARFNITENYSLAACGARYRKRFMELGLEPLQKEIE